MTKRSWSQLDGVIALDESNMDAWRERLGPERVYRATLGVDVDYWRPGEGGDRCLTVGNHLRDFDLLERVIDACPNVHFDLVIPAPQHARFARYDNAACAADITDEKLAALYRNAALLFLPLKGGSASNTLLQGLASGLPIVTTAFDGAASYLADDCAVTVPPGDVEAATAAVHSLVHAPQRRRTMGAAARARSTSFAWSAVSARHQEIYRAVSTS